MTSEEEFYDYLNGKYMQESRRRDQATLLEDLGFPAVAAQLYHWDQYKLSYAEMIRGKQTENDQA